MAVRICFLFSLLLAFSICGSAQEPCLQIHPDRFPNASFKIEKRRLYNAAKALKEFPDQKIYLIVYGKKSGSKSETTKRLKQSSRYLQQKHQISAQRIVAVDAGTMQDLEMQIFVNNPNSEKLPCTSALRF